MHGVSKMIAAGTISPSLKQTVEGKARQVKVHTIDVPVQMAFSLDSDPKAATLLTLKRPWVKSQAWEKAPTGAQKVRAAARRHRPGRLGQTATNQNEREGMKFATSSTGCAPLGA